MVDGAYEPYRVHTLPNYKDVSSATQIYFIIFLNLWWSKKHDEDCVKGTFIVSRLCQGILSLCLAGWYIQFAFT